MNGNVEKVYKLTPMQEGILFQSLKEESSYLDQYSCRLKGEIKYNALVEAWKTVVKEYAIFRTAFVHQQVSEPLQVVVKNVDPQINVFDYSKLNEDEFEKKIEEFRKEDLKKGFDITKPCLLRVSLLKKNDNECEYVWTIHHLIIDGVSVPILMKRVYEIYHCLIFNKDISDNKPMQFGEYVAWLKRQSTEDLDNFWSEYLKNVKYPTIVSNNNENENSKYLNCRSSFIIPDELAESILKIAKSNNISEFQIYNIAYAILLHRYTGQKSVLYGKLVSGRPTSIAGISKAIGVFINNIPNFVSFSGNITVRELIEKEIKHHVRANAYEFVSQVKVHELTGIQQELYDSLFLFENYEIDKIYDEDYVGFSISDESIAESTNFNLNWIVRPAKNMELNIVFNGLSFDEKQIESMARSYVKILGKIAENLDIRIADISLSDEKTKVIDCFGNFLPTWFKGKILNSDNISTNDVGYMDDMGEIHIDRTFSSSIIIGEKKILRDDIARMLVEKGVVEGCIVVYFGKATGKTIICYLDNSDQPEPTIKRHIIKAISQDLEIPKKLLKESIDFIKCDELPNLPDQDDEINTMLQIIKDELRKRTICANIVNFPETDSEKAMEAIWSEVLGFEEIDTKVSFFELGGNSIDLMKIVSRVRQVFEKEISINEIIKYSTIHELTTYVDSKHDKKEIAESVKLTLEQKRLGVEASFAQKRFWFLNQYYKNDSFNNLAESIRLTGYVDEERLKTALKELCVRQESLRTTFFMNNGVIYQKVNDETNLDYEIINIQESKGDEEYIDKCILEIVKQPFNLNEGSIFKCRLLKVSDLETILVISIHHIISDGWSLQIFFDELMQLYSAITNNISLDSIEPPKIQYSEYSEWKRQLTTEEYNNKERTFWNDYLNGVEELAFPTDFNRPAEQSFHGLRSYYELPVTLKTEIDELALKFGTTSFNIYFTSYIILLHRYTQQYDITVGIPYGARELIGTETTIGCFLNSVAFRSILKKDMSFSEALKIVMKDMNLVLQHGQYPFDLVVDSVSEKRDMSKNPIFQLMFLFQNIPSIKETLTDIAFERMEIRGNSSMMDFSLYVKEKDDKVEVLAEYNDLLFREQTISRFLVHFENTLRAFVDNQEQSIETFDYMFENEKKEIFEKFNDTNEDLGTDKFIHQLFEEQAELYPEREALIFEDTHLSYAELNKRANQLANYLINNGTKKNQIIGVYMKRSVEMVVALYGILKAGAAYLPLDSSYPEKRIKYMIEDSEVQTILVNENVENILDKFGGKIVNIRENNELDICADTNPNVIIDENDYAYMIYTSGSTGKPKGVINIHKGIRNRILWIRTYFKEDPDSRQMQKTPFSFDVSLGEFFGSLTNGACLVVARPDGHKDVDYMIDLIIKEKVTHVHFVPSLLKQFMASERVEQCRDIIRQICCTGEPLPYELVEEVKNKLPNADIFNLYGPTEAAVEVTCWNCKDKIDKRIIPIGKPICNTQIYILDPYMKVVPIGVIGELYIAGDNLAVGYFHREELTSERFINSPFEEGQKIYRTGDYARYMPDGNIEFIGRIDNQVKIRGNRIEIGEIETDLSKCEGVKDCAVIVSKEESPRIIAFVIPVYDDDDYKRKLVPNLRQELGQKLPDYMIPSIFMFVDKFELLPNGKRNLSKLPAPSIETEITSIDYVAPEDEIQQKVADIWSEILGISKIGINDNFFEIGGHSISAMELTRRINQSFSVNIPTVAIFKYPTVKKLTEMLQGGDDSSKQIEKKNDRNKMLAARKKQGELMKKLRSEKEHSNE